MIVIGKQVSVALSLGNALLERLNKSLTILEKVSVALSLGNALLENRDDKALADLACQ